MIDCLVTGATGNAGSAVAAALLARGARVRALVRSGHGAGVPSGCEAVEGDLDDPASVRAAAAGTDAVFALAGYPGIDGAIPALAAGGVRRIVVMSNLGAARGDLSNAVDAFHVRTEEAVRASGLSWTVLRSYALMSNVFRWTDQLAHGDLVRLPFADVPIAAVDPADLGEVAAICLTEPGHDGLAHPVSGGRAWLPAEQVAAVAEALGRPIRFEAVPPDVARTEMLATMPAAYVDAFFRYYVDGEIDETTVVDTVQRLTGHPPASLGDYLARPAVADRLAPLRGAETEDGEWGA